MLYRGFAGSSNPSQSVISDGERTVNWFVEPIQSEGAQSSPALYPTPGVEALATVSQVGTRAFGVAGSRSFAVIGGGYYEISDTWGMTLIGAVAQDSNPATISYSGQSGGQVFVTSGGNGYVHTLATNAFAQVLTAEATMGGMLNARFLAFNITNGRVRMSGLNDGLTWDPLLYFQRSQAPDPWQAMIVNQSEVWMIGQQTGEVWYDAGLYPQPFAARPGAVFPWGTLAPFSVGLSGSIVTWLGRSANGSGSIVAASGYTPQSISNYAVEDKITGYIRDSTVDDAEVLTYEQSGHAFAVWSFPTAKASWAFDFSTGLWHERDTWDSAAGRSNAWAPRVHGLINGVHVVGARSSGTIYRLCPTLGLDVGGAPIRRLRIGPPLWAESRQRLAVSDFEIILEAGLGLVSGQGADPQVMLRTSTDGKTWSSERMASAGKMGEYRRRCRWSRCGSSDKLWMPEVTVTDPIPWRLSAADVLGDGFRQQAQRVQ